MMDQAENDYLCQTGEGTPMGNLFRRYWIPFLISSEIEKPDCDPVRVRLMGGRPGRVPGHGRQYRPDRPALCSPGGLPLVRP